VGPTTPRQRLNPPNGDVFAEMRSCLERGISGRPSLARFVEVTYEGMLSLKSQLDRIEARLSPLEPSTKTTLRPGSGIRRHR
jgi:hypothetical protein